MKLDAVSRMSGESVCHNTNCEKYAEIEFQRDVCILYMDKFLHCSLFSCTLREGHVNFKIRAYE